MKADQARVRDLLTQTITLMCRNGLEFSRDIRVEGLLAVTVDGTDIFVIHMDEKVTDQPSYAGASHCSESIVMRQQRDSASGAGSDADEISADHINDDLVPSTSSAVGDKSERNSAFHTEDEHVIKTEPNVEDSDDDIVVMESGVRSNIPLPVLQGMNEYEDGSPGRMPFSPVSKRRRICHKRTSLFAGAAASIESTRVNWLGSADQWTGSASCVPHGNNVCVQQTRDSDILHHTSTYDMLPHTSTNGSQALVSCCY